MTYTVHLVFSWSWWAFAAGIAVGAIGGTVAMRLLIIDAIAMAWARR
jgi:hypothetical protein